LLTKTLKVSVSYLIGTQPQLLERVQLVGRGVAEDGDVLDGVAAQVQADQTPEFQNPGIDFLQIDGCKKDIAQGSV